MSAVPMRHCSGYVLPDGDAIVAPHDAPVAAFYLTAARCRSCEAQRSRHRRAAEQLAREQHEGTPLSEPMRRCSGYGQALGAAIVRSHMAPVSAFSPTSSRCRACEAERQRDQRAAVAARRERARREAAPVPVPVVPEPPGLFPVGVVRPLDRLRARRRTERVAAGEFIELEM